MKQFSHEISLETNGRFEFVDITDMVRDAVSKSGVEEGIVTVFSQHTTCAVKINERCDRLQKDMLTHLENAVPGLEYKHDEDTLDGRPNARGHLMSMLLCASETMPVSGGKPALGGWQSVFFVELDGPRPVRKLTVKVIGD